MKGISHFQNGSILVLHDGVRQVLTIELKERKRLTRTISATKFQFIVRFYNKVFKETDNTSPQK